MPPALSDDSESSGDESIPAQQKGKQPAAQAEPEDEVPESEGEEAEDEYVVEKILGHKFVKGEIIFDVKWQGYDDPKDRTWEPEANMEGAIDVMKEYFEEIGGRPEPKGQKRKGRPSAATSESGTPATSSKRAKQEKQWSPPPGSWEHEISHIDTVEESLNPKTGQLERFAYLVWNNQKKTQHPLKHTYQKCPQKMLQYYESHLVFTQNNDVLNGDDDGNVSMKDSY
ncbi:Nn.00g061060.m01.CDS01 [Neocucurbitaria sp. VM-36]